MELRRLGRTGLKVSVLGYGAGAVGGLFTKGRPDDQERAAARAIEAGINYFDTAALYGNGESEKNLGRVLKALKEAGKIGKVTIIGFDEDPITLGGVKEGTIVGTVVQQPYEWGYQGMKMMAKYLEGDKSFIPANKLIIIPTKIIDKSNVDAFWAELKQRQGKK